MPLNIYGGQLLWFKLFLRRGHTLKMEESFSVNWQFKSSGRTIETSLMLLKEKDFHSWDNTDSFHLYQARPSTAATRNFASVSGQMFCSFCV